MSRLNKLKTDITYYVTPVGRTGWAIRRHGNIRATAHYDTKKEAVNEALSRAGGGRVALFDETGRLKAILP